MSNVYLCQPDELAHALGPLRAIGNRVNDPDLPNTILKACLNKRAFFFACGNVRFVLCPRPSAVLVWALWAVGPSVHAEVGAAIESLALEIGVPRLEFWTARRGFGRVAARHGYASRPDVWCGVPVTVWSKSL